MLIVRYDLQLPVEHDVTMSYMLTCHPQALDLEGIKTHHWQITACSAVTGERLLDGVNWLTADISSRIFTMD